jgi:hypothetical protein
MPTKYTIEPPAPKSKYTVEAPTATPDNSPKPEDRTFGNYASEIAGGVGRGFSNLAEGAYQSFVHPRDTAQGIKDQTVDAVDAAQQDFSNKQGQPLIQRGVSAGLTFLENAPIVGGMVQKEEEGYHGTILPSPEEAGATAEAVTSFGVAPYVAGKMTSKLVDTVKTARQKALESVTKTGPRVARKAVEETQATNTKAVDDAVERNQDIADKRMDELRKHSEALSRYRQEPTPALDGTEKAPTAAEITSRKEALSRGIEQIDPQLKESLEATEKDIHAKAEAKYNDIRKAIGDKPAEPYQAVDEEGHIQGEPVPLLQHIFDEAAGKISDWSKAPTLLKAIGDRLEGIKDPVRNQDATVTWSDLQDLRTKVSRELRKGTLPPDEYLAFKSMRENIDAGMQKIADTHGLGKAQTAARNYYREFAQAFWDKGPIRSALESKERGGVTKAFRGKDQSGIETLAKFHPELARRINTVRGYAEESSTIGTPKQAPAKPAPKLAPRKPDVVPQKTVLTPEELTRRKQEAARDHAEKLWNSSSHLATVFVVLDTVRKLNPFNFHPGGAAIDVGSRIAYGAGKNAFANYLESPKVMEAVGKITEADVKEVMKLPPDQRAGFENLVMESQARGAKLKPGVLSTMFGVAKTAAKAAPILGIQGKKTKHLRELRDKAAFTDNSVQ